MTTTYRYSTLSDSDRCLKYYELRHILGMDNNSDKNADLKFGTSLHLGIQDLFEGGNGLDAFNILWNSYEEDGLEYSRLRHKDLSNLGNIFIERFERLHLKHFIPAHIEKKMSFNPLGSQYVLSGTPDFLGSYKGVPSVVDWKTSGYAYDKAKLVINEQMPGYMAMAKEAVGYEAQQLVYVVFVKNPKEPRIQVLTKLPTVDKINSVLENIVARCKDLERRSGSKEYPRNPQSCLIGTRKCDFYSVCYKGE